jgi:hypothetical protein
MNYRSKAGINLAFLAVLVLQLFPISPTQAWFGNGQCKKAITSANKSVSDYAILSRVILNNKKCFDPIVVANAQLCIKLNWGSGNSLQNMKADFACSDLPKKYK